MNQSNSLDALIPLYNSSLPDALRSINSLLESKFIQQVIIGENPGKSSLLPQLRLHYSSNPRVKLFQFETYEPMFRNWLRIIDLSSSDYFLLLPCGDAIISEAFDNVFLGALNANLPVAAICSRRRLLFSSSLLQFVNAAYLRLNRISDITKPCYSGGLGGHYIRSEDFPKILRRKCYNFIGEPGSVIYHRSLALSKGQSRNSNQLRISQYLANRYPYTTDLCLHYYFFCLPAPSRIFLADTITTCFEVDTDSGTWRMRNKHSTDLCCFINHLSPRKLTFFEVTSIRLRTLARLTLYKLNEILF